MTWTAYFLSLLGPIAAKSKDPSRKVAAIITGKDHGVVSTGFNGFPRGCGDGPECFSGRYERPWKYLWTEHAERNAIYNAAKRGISLEGATMYSSVMPCADCARAIIQSGIGVLVVPAGAELFVSGGGALWEEHSQVAEGMLREAGVIVRRPER